MSTDIINEACESLRDHIEENINKEELTRCLENTLRRYEDRLEHVAIDEVTIARNGKMVDARVKYTICYNEPDQATVTRKHNDLRAVFPDDRTVEDVIGLPIITN